VSWPLYPKKLNNKKKNWLRATLHLEIRPTCCVRGLKSSIVIIQKFEIGPNPNTWTSNQFGRMNFLFKKDMISYGPKTQWIGCTKNGRPILGFVRFQFKKVFFKSIIFFNKSILLDILQLNSRRIGPKKKERGTEIF